MNFLELNQKAKQIALKNLEGKFDWQAFLVLSQAVFNEERLGKPVDLVPESSVDEAIKDLLTLFVEYINSKKANSGEVEISNKLDKLLNQNLRILKEIKLSCATNAEKQIFKNYIEQIRKVE